MFRRYPVHQSRAITLELDDNPVAHDPVKRALGVHLDGGPVNTAVKRLRCRISRSEMAHPRAWGRPGRRRDRSYSKAGHR
jgi:hypothetical protein